MSKFRFLIVGAGAALAIGGASALANVSPMTLTKTDADSRGDAVASAARTTCPHEPAGVHGACVSAIASAKAESEDKATDKDESTVTKDADTDKDIGATTKDADKDKDRGNHADKDRGKR
jgi:hypothetical protein